VQDALLRIALAPTDAVEAAWTRHRPTIPVDDLGALDWGARRLVPLVAWRLREAGVPDEAAAGLRADLAASMLAVRAKQPAFTAVLDVLAGAGLDALVLKGVGIALLAYPDPGTRPVSDLDVLVPADQAPALDDLVARHGGYTSYDALDPLVRRRWRHGAEARLDGHEVDVHWRLLVDRFDGRPDVALFERARPICVGGRPARTLAAEDHLVHAIAHGVRRNTLAPVRWIPDVARLVQRQPLDWALVTEEATRRHVAGVVGRALDLVRDRYGVAVPDDARRALRRASGPTRGRLDVWSRSPKASRLGGAVNVAVVHYALATQGWPALERGRRYPEYLRTRLAVADVDARLDRSSRGWHG
jgi:hypothetical protein